MVTCDPACDSGRPSALPEIERFAGERFREVGLSDVADDEPFSQDELARYAADGRCWVALDESGNPIGYVLLDEADGNANRTSAPHHRRDEVGGR